MELVNPDDLNSVESRLKLEIIEKLSEPCDRKTYGERLRSAAQQLKCSVRTVQRLMKKWEEEGLAALIDSGRIDKGKPRIAEDWQQFIKKVYSNDKCTPAQVFTKVRNKARQEGLKDYPSHMTVYRILRLVKEAKEKEESIRNLGWKGSRLALKTRDGEVLEIDYSNQVWQCDHTRADILLVDKYGHQMGRPWLTTVIDTYSRAIVGINLGYDAPSSSVVALALRNAIMPKQYGVEYKLYADWPTCGTPDHLFTDGGKDFRSNHLRQIGLQLGFICHLRDRPSEGGIVERPFGTINTQFLSTLPGYTGSNVQDRPPEAEAEACLTLQELEKLLVAYIVNTYNQRLDARMGDQTRIQRWEAGLLKQPRVIPEHELHICLMRQTRRTIYRGGYLQFENLAYRGEALAEHAGENIVLRYDPRNIAQVLVYRHDPDREVYLGVAQALEFEGEVLALDDAKAHSRRIREDGKAVSNDAMLDEMRDREAFVDQKNKSRKDRQKDEQADLRPTTPPIIGPDSSDEPSVDVQPDESPEELDIPEFDIWDFDDDDA
ncbi:Mu transposase C-terminal domain-containing protein [Leptolyngbya iicbica]|uniref:Transposase n=2 Tax=Cyanophyceae TaxID=3028117 RepID=A0A4Q7E829_9CYAN|nr:Mu transposase C-terminal domain-containing protein [Leptolyngbya sp. LK]RZM78651.1 transposase [Leptolyngbya sp. LK]